MLVELHSAVLAVDLPLADTHRVGGRDVGHGAACSSVLFYLMTGLSERHKSC